MAARVPACEYGQDATVVLATPPAVLESPVPVPTAPAAVAPIVSNLPSLLV